MQQRSTSPILAVELQNCQKNSCHSCPEQFNRYGRAKPAHPRLNLLAVKGALGSSDSNGAPGIKSGRRKLVLGFLVKPGMHTSSWNSPLGI